MIMRTRIASIVVTSAFGAIVCIATIHVMFLPVSAQKVVNTTPITFAAPDSIADWDPVSLSIQRATAGLDTPTQIRIVIVGSGTNKKAEIFIYPDPTVAAYDTEAEVDTLITAINTARLDQTYAGTLSLYGPNATAGSLWRRIFHRLCSDHMPGSADVRFPNGCSVQ